MTTHKERANSDWRALSTIFQRMLPSCIERIHALLAAMMAKESSASCEQKRGKGTILQTTLPWSMALTVCAARSVQDHASAHVLPNGAKN